MSCQTGAAFETFQPRLLLPKNLLPGFKAGKASWKGGWKGRLERQAGQEARKADGKGRLERSQRRHAWEGMLKGQAEKAGFRAHLRGMALLGGRPRSPAHSRQE